MIGRLATLFRYLARRPLQGSAELGGALTNRLRRRSPLRDQVPWMPFDAIRFLSEAVHADWRIFEYGSGGSTLFFARLASQVVTVEHDIDWACQVEEALAERGIENVEFLAIPPRPGNVPDYSSAVGGYEGQSFRAYAEAIDRFPDGHFDLVVVDGRARNACLRHAVQKIKSGGLLVLDNSDREKYQPGIEFLAHFERAGFRGLNPYQIDPGQTTVWTIRHSS